MAEQIKTMFVVPAPGGLVRMWPGREVMPETGAEVPDDVYWNRRLLHGDVLPAPKAVESVPTHANEVRKTKKEPKE